MSGSMQKNRKKFWRYFIEKWVFSFQRGQDLLQYNMPKLYLEVPTRTSNKWWEIEKGDL